MDLKCVFGEGMPTYRNPFEKGKLIVKFAVDFPEAVDPHVAQKLEALLPPKYVVSAYIVFIFYNWAPSPIKFA